MSPPKDTGDAGGETADGGDARASSDVATPDASGNADTGADVDAGNDGCPSDAGVPNELRCTGLYSDWASKTIAPGVMAYTPGLVFWSDGAVKSRWLYLPPGTQIDTTDMDNWVFPVGTKIWKQFVVGGQTIETRLLWKTDAYDWVYLDYRWSPDGTSTQRLDTGEKNVNGTTYEIPATNVCSQCHNGSPDTVLGIDFVGLATSGVEGVTVATLEAQNAFTKNPPSTTLAIPEDSTGKAAAALGWLHVNCGIGCHNANPGAGASQTQLYLKLVAGEILMADGGVGPVSGLDTYTRAVGVAAIEMPNGMPVERIDPGHAGESLVSILAGTRCNDAGVGCIQMPPIVSHIPDDAGLALVNAWINALPPVGDP
jgi:hypothetical protein